MRSFTFLAVVAVGWLLPFAGAQPPEKAAAERLTLDDLDFLTGKWVGTLEYLDFTDGKTRRKIDATMACKHAHEAFDYKFSCVDPAGKKVEGESTKVSLQENGTQVKLNDELWKVAGKTIDPKNQKYEIVLTRDDIDDKKPGMLRRIISFDKDTLRMRLEVQHEKAEKTFVRNEYVLKRQ